MTRDRSADERISDWLREEAPSQLPDRVFRATFERTRTSGQRRRLFGWSRPWPFGLTPAAALTGIVVVIAVVVGVALLPRSNQTVGGPAGPSQSPSPSPPASPEPPIAAVTGLPGRFVFASVRDGDYDIYTMNPDRTALHQLTDAAGQDVAPSWSRDGSRIAFASNRDGDYDIYVVNADGTGETQLADLAGDQYPGGWSSDGLRLAYTTSKAERFSLSVMNTDGSSQRDLIGTGDNGVQYVTGGQWLADDSSLVIEIDKSTTGGEMDLYRLDIASGAVTALTSYSGDDNSAALSPDEARIAFQSDRDGGCVYVMNADGRGVVQLTTGCRTGFPISWSPDGRLIGWAGDRPKAGPSDIRVIDTTGGAAIQLTDTHDIADLAWGPASP
jgi:hypothetical protein